MKTKVIFLFAITITLTSFITNQKIDDKQFYNVVIFKLSKNEAGNQYKKVITINQEGQIIVNSKLTNQSVNLKNFTEGIDKFIKRENLEKEPAYNGLPKVAPMPQNGEQYVSVSIIKLKDFISEKDFDNNSRYIFRKITKSSDENIVIYKYLKSDDLKTLKKLF